MSREPLIPEEEVWADIRITDALVKGHWYFNEYDTEHVVDPRRLFSVCENAAKYGRALYSEFEDFNVDAVVSPGSRGGLLLAKEVASRLGQGVRLLWARREQGIVSTSDMQLKKGASVIIVDDGINTGSSLTQLLANLRIRFDCNCVGIGILIDRYIGSLMEDFVKDGHPKLVSIFPLRQVYPIVRREKCRACQRQQEINDELKAMAESGATERKFELVRESLDLTRRSGYDL